MRRENKFRKMTTRERDRQTEIATNGFFRFMYIYVFSFDKERFVANFG